MNDTKITLPFDLNQVDIESMSVMSLLRLGGGALLKHAIAMEITEHLGRGRYERTEDSEQFKGYRNGHQDTRIDTPIGQIEYDRPKVVHASDFKSKFHVPHMRRPEEFASAITDMYVNGTSTRKVKNSLKAVTGKKVKLGKSTISRITKRLKHEFKEWKERSLADLDIVYLFLDAIRVGMRMGGTDKDSVLLAYGVTSTGQWEVLAIDISRAESKKAWGSFVGKLQSRGLRDPLLVISDGNAGVIESIDSNFETSYRQRCLKHRFENILDAVPKDEQKPVEEKLKQVFYGATSLEQAKSFVKQFKKTFEKRYPTAISRFNTDLDQCLTYYLFPSHHWRRIRTANKLERLNREIRRRLNVIGRHPDEDGCLTLIYKVTLAYASNQIGWKADVFTENLWNKLRKDKLSMIKQLKLDLYAECA